jgi:hypothetical protein
VGIGHGGRVSARTHPGHLASGRRISAGFTAHAGGSAPQPANSDCNFADPGVQIGEHHAVREDTALRLSAASSRASAEKGVEGHYHARRCKLPTTATVKFGGKPTFDGTGWSFRRST